MNWLKKILGFKNKVIKNTSLKCPNCGNDKWIEGPGGGSYGNIKCSNCQKKYNNLGIFGLQEI